MWKRSRIAMTSTERSSCMVGRTMTPGSRADSSRAKAGASLGSTSRTLIAPTDSLVARVPRVAAQLQQIREVEACLEPSLAQTSRVRDRLVAADDAERSSVCARRIARQHDDVADLQLLGGDELARDEDRGRRVRGCRGRGRGGEAEHRSRASTEEPRRACERGFYAIGRGNSGPLRQSLHFSRGPSAPRSLSASDPNRAGASESVRSLYSRSSAASCASGTLPVRRAPGTISG